MENLGRTLIKIKWQTGSESYLLPDDLDSYDGRWVKPEQFDN